MNNYEFWEKYLYYLKQKINALMESKEQFKVDLHIHTTYSSDGKVSLKDTIKHYKKNKFDIISITDHDSIEAYDELYEIIINNELNNIIVIPGVELTVNEKEYGAQCHILQYMFNPKEKNIIKTTKKSIDSYFNRTTKQFIRIKENLSLQYFINKYNINISEEEYYQYLKKESISIPDYDNLVKYIYEKLIEKNITVLDVFDRVEKDNKLDKCIERREIKSKRFEVLRNKYKDDINAKSSTRLLLSILAVKNVDDDYYSDYLSSGGLSVNNYGQLTIDELYKENLTIFAHPTEKVVNIVDKLLKKHSFIKGIEDNMKNKYDDSTAFYKLANDNSLFITKGSDFHKVEDLDLESDFYLYNKLELLDLMKGVLNGKD